MNNHTSLHKRINKIFASIEQQQSEPLSQQWQHAGELIQEGLKRKLALLSEDSDQVPEDYSERCKRIDRELEQERTQEERVLLTRYRYAFPCKGARAALLQKLARYQYEDIIA
jgi:hypothetical protein